MFVYFSVQRVPISSYYPLHNAYKCLGNSTSNKTMILEAPNLLLLNKISHVGLSSGRAYLCWATWRVSPQYRLVHGGLPRSLASALVVYRLMASNNYTLVPLLSQWLSRAHYGILPVGSFLPLQSMLAAVTWRHLLDWTREASSSLVLAEDKMTGRARGWLGASLSPATLSMVSVGFLTA